MFEANATCDLNTKLRIGVVVVNRNFEAISNEVAVEIIRWI